MTFTHIAELYRSVGKSKKCTFIFCADHGVAKENVSAYPQATTADMVRNYLIDAGAAALPNSPIPSFTSLMSALTRIFQICPVLSTGKSHAARITLPREPQ